MIARRLCALVAALVASAACGSDGAPARGPDSSDGVRIASFDFAESVLLAEMYSQAIEATGTPVVRLGAVGPREVVAPALEIGRVDLVPEYLGTALHRLGSDAPNPDTDEALAELVDRLEPLGLTALAAAPAQDHNVVVVTADFADREGIDAISDLAPLAADLRFGGPAECPERPLCLVGLEEVYGLRFAEFVAQRSQAFTGEALRRDEIQVGLMFSTAAPLTADDLVVLEDDLALQPAENVVPIVRREALDRWGDQITATLDALSSALTTPDVRLLNARVARGERVEDMAHAWLASRDLVAD